MRRDQNPRRYRFDLQAQHLDINKKKKGSLRGGHHEFLECVHSLKKERLNTVSLPQLIVDLFEEGGVCVTAAQKLLEKVVKNTVRTS